MAPTKSVFMGVDTALGQMIAQIQASGAAITDFTEGSAIRTMLEADAVVISNNTAVADQLQQDSYLDTATGDALDALGFANWQVARKPAVQAAGQITITRQSTSGALSIPAGWGQLATVPTAPGDTGVSAVTLDDADFANGVATATVNAQAVIGGTQGNLAAGTFLTPLAPITGVSSQNGYEVTTAFTNGVDVETDDAYRARIPIAVQGRILGRKPAFLAAALAVPGVPSASVLGAGDTRGDGSTIPAGSVEVYYQGSAGLLSAVQSAVANAAVFNQNPLAFASVSLVAPRGQKRIVATLTVYCLSGTDPLALAVSVTNALQAYVNSVGVGNTVRYSLAVEAALGVSGVVSVGLPLTQFSLFGGGGAADITILADSYANLAAGDVLVTVTAL